MRFQIFFAALAIFICAACELQTFSAPKLNEEKMELVDYYLGLLQAEKIEIHPLDYEWKDSDLPILIKNSRLVQITKDNELTNIETIDTIASVLWNAVENKEKYDFIKVVIEQSSKSGIVNNIQYQSLDYPTNILK